MYEDEIDGLRRQLAGASGRSRIALQIALAQHLCNRWAAQPSAPSAERDLVEAIALLREARGALSRDDVWRAQLSLTLGCILTVHTVRSGILIEDRSQCDEAMACLTEAIEHPDQPAANLEMGLVYSALLLLVLAIPPGAAAGIDPRHASPLNMTDMAGVLAWFQLAGSPQRKASLDRAEELLTRLRTMPPVNPQVHEMGTVVLSQIQLMRTFGEMTNMMSAFTRLAAMWQQPPTASRPPEPGPYGGVLPGLFGGIGLPVPSSFGGSRDGLPPITLPQIAAIPTPLPPPIVIDGVLDQPSHCATGPESGERADSTPPETSRPQRQKERSEQRVVTIDPEDLDHVLSLARAREVEVEVHEPGERVGHGGEHPAVTVLLLGGVRGVSAVLDAIERRQGGQVIDLRQGPTPVFSRDRGIAYGVVLILTADEGFEVQVHQPRESLSQIVDAVRRLLSELSGQPADQIVEILDRAVGDRATVTRSH